MTTYVYSLHGGAKVTHIGSAAGAACGAVFMSTFNVSLIAPPNRPLCAICVARVGTREALTVAKTRRLREMVQAKDANATYRAALRADRQAERDAAIVALLAEGLDNVGVGRRLRMSLRTVTREVNGAMYRAGAKSRFQWGYHVGTVSG